MDLKHSTNKWQCHFHIYRNGKLILKTVATHWKFWRIFLFSCIDCSSFCILILLIRNFIFILPTVFMCKTTSNPPIDRNIITCFQHTHMWWKYVAEEDLDLECFHWNPFVPMKRVHTHSATSVQVNSAILYIHNTQYSTQYMNERYQLQQV